jgi:hypothetical protein
VPFLGCYASINAPIHFSDSPHRFFAAMLSFFQFDRIKRAALSSTTHGVFFPAHYSTADFRCNFL